MRPRSPRRTPAVWRTSGQAVRGAAVVALFLTAEPPDRLTGQTANSAAAPSATYWAYVANESSDLVSRVRFGPDGLVEEKTIPVGIMPADLDGAHGLTVGPDGHWYVSLAHGTPYGAVWKFAAGSDELQGTATAGLFPASMAVTPDGSLLFVVNFNLHGNHVPSSVSVIFTPTMQELTKVETCIMPHGGRINRAGTRHYSACMMSDQLVEISTERLAVRRRLSLTPGHEGLVEREAADHMAHGSDVCSPTWVTISPDDRYLYVPCNKRAEVLEIDAGSLQITRRLPTGKGPYNADTSPDGRLLVVTLKGNQGVAVFDRASGEEKRIPTSQPITHGVAITPDSRYAFVSNEAIGATRGTVDVIDLGAGRIVASQPLQFQSGGIALWRMESAPD